MEDTGRDTSPAPSIFLFIMGLESFVLYALLTHNPTHVSMSEQIQRHDEPMQQTVSEMSVRWDPYGCRQHL